MQPADLYIDGQATCPVVVARSPLGRLRGMVLRRPVPEALVVIRSTSVHAAGMRHPLDVAMLDESGTVVSTSIVRPWHVVWSRGRLNVLEAPVGSFARWGVRPGTRVSIVPR